MQLSMLIALSVRDFVLIDALDLSVHRGFTSVTGETGAGKSILLEALRFVTGGKSDKRFIRVGADKTAVSASFQLPEGHMVLQEMDDRGLSAEDGLVTLRRVLNANGPSRMFANDQIISADFAKLLGEQLLEIHGQHDSSALLNAALHKDVLDAYAQAEPLLNRTRTTFEDWDAARSALDKLLAEARTRESEIAQAEAIVEELDALSPQEGEAARLGIERALLMNSQKLAECLSDADEAVRSCNAADVFGSVARSLERACRLPELVEAGEDNPQLQALKSAQESVERVLIELGESSFAVETARASFEHDPDALESCESRLFALRAAGRKYGVSPDELAVLLQESQDRLEALGAFETRTEDARKAVTETEMAYLEASGKLSALRKSSGEQLATVVMKELAPLKLERAVFRVRVDEKPMDKAGPDGRDAIVFEVQTNPGAPFGPLHKIASGGELARFTLALRVCLADIQSTGLLIFDEADQGVGGAVAAAVGERLSRLAEDRQVLAITHSPQVAAAGHTHWHISKNVSDEDTTSSKVTVLSGNTRLEEIARMLSGSEITNEARAAAERLMTEPV